MVLLESAPSPLAVLSLPVVLLKSASYPLAVLEVPVLTARAPNADPQVTGSPGYAETGPTLADIPRQVQIAIRAARSERRPSRGQVQRPRPDEKMPVPASPEKLSDGALAVPCASVIPVDGA